MLRSMTIEDGCTPGAIIIISQSKAFILGRAPVAEVALPDHPAVKGLISRRHASVQLKGEDLVITDLGSLNGTWYEAPAQHKQLHRLLPHVPELLAPGSTVYFGGQKLVKDSHGAIAPNPYVYLYLGACQNALQLHQSQIAASQPAGSSAAKNARQQLQRNQKQQPPQELLPQQASDTPWQQQQRLQQLEQHPKQQQQQQGQLLHMQPPGMAQEQQQHKRRRLGDLQSALQAPHLLADVQQQLPVMKGEQTNCNSGATGNTVQAEQRCKPVQNQEHQVQLCRQQHQQHYKQQQQQQRQYEQQQRQQGQGAPQRAAANDQQLPCLWTGALTEMDINLPSALQNATGVQKPMCSILDALQDVHNVRGTAATAAADTQHTVSDLTAGAAAAVAKAGSTEQLQQAGSSRCQEHDKDMRQVSSSHLDCAVCKDLLAAAHALSCGHMFCGVCLAHWLELRQEPSCPSCRATVKSVPVRLFTMDDIVAEAQFSQGSECQERAARLQQWGEIKDATLAHWQQRFQPEIGSSKHNSKKAGRGAPGGIAAQQQANPQVPAGVVPLLGAARQGRAAAGRQAGAPATEQPAAREVQRQQQHTWQGRQQQAGAGEPAAAVHGGLRHATTTGRSASGRRRVRGGKGRYAGVARAQQPAAAQLPTQLQPRVELPRHLRQMAINTFVSGTTADSAGRHA